MYLLFKQFKVGKYHLPFAYFLWFALTVIAVSLEMSRGIGDINNYLVFKQVFWHAVQQQNLYLPYPNEYNDLNHYGPLFGVLIAPFAILPVFVGCFLWCIANASLLFVGIIKLPITEKQKWLILLISSVELMTSIHNVQYNAMVAAWLVLAYVCLEAKKDFWCTFFIAVGFLTKLYGIAGLVFFFFSDRKVNFVFYFIFWMCVLLALPLTITSPGFLVQTYKDWYQSIVMKNVQNMQSSAVGGMQDISLIGLIRRCFALPLLPIKYVLAPTALLYFLPLFKIKQYKEVVFRLLYLALSLISVVVLSPSAESPTYVIAVVGVAIWYVVQDVSTTKWQLYLLFL